ncbi:MAG: methyltransferase domain-containing protein [Rhodoblastus sp.]|nr:methyltransferase domain-containing protein [Rhodoblastus sp.]
MTTPDDKNEHLDRAQLQAQIDAVDWYHEFDFGDGLRAVTKSQAQDHREIWRFIETNLARIDFSGRSVLEIGCWDGYWSFYAEKRGAREVLATDDTTQNWANGRGIHLAKQLLNSSIAIDQSISIYEASKLNRTFDIVLCLGVYYHLIDPFAGFAELRHCTHPDTIVVFEGDATLSLRPDTFLWDPSDSAKSAFVPTPAGLRQMLRAAYFDVESQVWMRPTPRWGLSMTTINPLSVPALVEPTSLKPLKHRDRMVTIARPFEGENPLHPYKPPFALWRYDPRFG